MELYKSRWEDLCAKFVAPESSKAIFNGLYERYNDPQRHYHNFSHIERSLKNFDEIKEGSLDHPIPFEIALWFHDAVYDPRSRNNEEASSSLAMHELILGGAHQSLIDLVCSMIMATKPGSAPKSLDEAYFVDIDLAIFGSLSEDFKKYEEQIRREYSHVPSVVYKAERAKILRGFLEQERIYKTPHFYSKYEVMARVNLEESLKRLTSR